MTALVPLVASAALVAAASANAQEEPLPPDVVARVGEEPIGKREFRDWLRKTARGQDRRGGVPKPPRFERCIAAERRRLATSRRRPSRRVLRLRCRRRYKQLRDEVMQFLVQGAWTRQEAKARAIVVPSREVRRQFKRQKRQAFEKERAYRRFLRRSGMTQADILYRVKLDLLQTRITRQVTAAAPPVPPAEVTDYYESNRRRFRKMSRRKARRVIRRLLRSQRQQQALDRFVKDFRERYTAVTVCAEGYVIAECSNAQGD